MACSFLREPSDRVIRSLQQVLAERQFPPVQLIDMLITEDCNCRCDYCFIHGKRPKRMSEEIVKATVDFLLIKSQSLKDVELLFLGGEPLLAFDLMQLAVDYGEFRSRCLGKRLTFAMTTNGTLFDDEKLRFCRDHGIRFLLSIDGDRETHNRHRKFADGRGSYDAVAGKIGLMKSYQPWMGARVTPTPENTNRLVANIQHLYCLGINQFIVGPASGLGYSDEDAGVLQEQLSILGDYYIEQVKAKAPFRLTLFEENLEERPGGKHNIWGCGAGRGRLSVSASGEMQPCAKVQGLNGLAGIPLYSLGNVLTGFSGLEARREFTTFHYDRRTACHDCGLKDDCAGGCPAVNYQASGCIWLPDPGECKLTRVILETKREIQRRLSGLSLAARGRTAGGKEGVRCCWSHRT